MKRIIPLLALAVAILCGCAPQTVDNQPAGSKGSKPPSVGGAPTSSAIGH